MQTLVTWLNSTLSTVRWLVVGAMLGGLLVGAFRTTAEPQSTYNPVLDVTHDGVITVQDIQSVAGAWNTTGDPSLFRAVSRSYYLTTTTHQGNQALNACIAGYHMASFAELFDLGTLRYAGELPEAAKAQDSGFGPPFSPVGWVRTGVLPSANATPGNANCEIWSSNASNVNGTTVGLDPVWNNAARNISPWSGLVRTCNTFQRVWCIQDY